MVTQRIANPCIPVRFWARPPILLNGWARIKMKNAIVVCATPNWLAPAAVTLLSCAQNGATAYADLFIVCPSPSAKDKSDLAAFNELNRTPIQLLAVDAGDLNDIDGGHLGIGALLRLKLDQFLPQNLERVLYLDCDVLAEGALDELFHMNLEGEPFAAVESIAMMPVINKHAPAHLRALNINPPRPYFNSGVILFDWPATVQARILPQCLEVLKSRQNWKFHDQDTLNIVSKGQWKKLDHQWNVTKKTADYLNLQAHLRHFNGNAKPWNCKNRFGYAKYRKYYEQSLQGTPWAEFLDMKQKPWPLKDNWRALVRRLSFLKRTKLRSLIQAQQKLK